MRLSRFKTFAGLATAMAMCMSPTVAIAGTTASIHSVNPLVAVSVFGTQASAQQVCNPATAAAAAGAAVAAQGQAGCVLPATDAPAPVVSDAPYVPQPSTGGGFGISPIILGLLGIAALAALIASSGDGDSDSPASPS